MLVSTTVRRSRPPRRGSASTAAVLLLLAAGALSGSPGHAAAQNAPGARGMSPGVVAPSDRAAARGMDPTPRGPLANVSPSRMVPGRWGVLVVSLQHGDTLLAVAPAAPIRPASTMKIVTAVTSLDILGADGTLGTQVLRSGVLRADGTLAGDLVLRSDGDPSASSRFVRGGGAVVYQALAEAVRDAGVRVVTGRLIADAGAFDDQRLPTGWQSRYLSASYAPRVSALSIDENMLDVVVRPGAHVGSAARVGVLPAAALDITGRIRTTAGRGVAVHVTALRSGTLVVAGTIGIGSRGATRRVMVEHPARVAAGVLRTALLDAGVTVRGATTMGATPAGAVVVARRRSPPLRTLVHEMDRLSVNHVAELLLRSTVYHATGAPAGAPATARFVRQWFATRAPVTRPDAIRVADGSGLSDSTQVSPEALVAALRYADRAPWAETFHASLPVAAASATLRRRFHGTEAAGNLHAKTGTTNTVTALSGYVRAANGEPLAFAVIYNGPRRQQAKAAIDELAATLATLQRAGQGGTPASAP